VSSVLPPPRAAAQGVRGQRHSSRVPRPRLARGRSRRRALGGEGSWGDRNRRRDHARDFWLAAESWEVLYALWADQQDPERFCRSVEKVYLRRLRASIVA
jgi:hypothetical protein